MLDLVGGDKSGGDVKIGEGGGEQKKKVAQGQYVVSDTRCPALHGCNLNERKQGSGPRGDKVL